MPSETSKDDARDAAALVSVFRTADEGLLPLAALALDQAGIDYTVRRAGLSDVFGVSHPTPGFSSTGTAVEIAVRQADAARVRDLLSDLERAGSSAAAPVREPEATPIAQAPAATPPSRQVVTLIDAESGRAAGTISRDEFEWLTARLVLESSADDDYYVDGATIEMLEQEGADAALLGVLRGAVAGRDGVTLRWE